MTSASIHAATPAEEINRRLDNLRAAMGAESLDALIINSPANIYYTTGRVVNGHVYIPRDGEAVWFVRRPLGLDGDGSRLVYVHKPEQIPDELEKLGMPLPARLGYEMSHLTCTDFARLSKVFPDAEAVNASPLIKRVRSVKTPFELDLLRRSGVKHVMVYSHIPRMYQPGMSDFELQVEIERRSRLEGCLGQFRIDGDSMELFMANILVGANADAPTPYDFAMGGAGSDPSLPVGADGTIIRRGESVMVDSNGNFTGYMTDMTRVYTLGGLSELALRAHRCSIDICRLLERLGVPGAKASELYEAATALVKERDLERYFMGYSQKAGFIGHGVGIEINELPVIAPRSRDVLAENNVIALEPKFVIPSAGAVGIENTYRVTPGGLECLTAAPEEITEFI